jgi:hypothetical protein
VRDDSRPRLVYMDGPVAVGAVALRAEPVLFHFSCGRSRNLLDDSGNRGGSDPPLGLLSRGLTGRDRQVAGDHPQGGLRAVKARKAD